MNSNRCFKKSEHVFKTVKQWSSADRNLQFLRTAQLRLVYRVDAVQRHRKDRRKTVNQRNDMIIVNCVCFIYEYIVLFLCFKCYAVLLI